MMSKFFYTLIISFLFIVKGIADEHVILIQCKDDRPELAFLQPIYEINLETKKAKAGHKDYEVLKFNNDEILIASFNSVVESRILFNRNTGRFEETLRFFSTTGNREDEKISKETGVCVRKEKAF